MKTIKVNAPEYMRLKKAEQGIFLKGIKSNDIIPMSDQGQKDTDWDFLIECMGQIYQKRAKTLWNVIIDSKEELYLVGPAGNRNKVLFDDYGRVIKALDQHSWPIFIQRFSLILFKKGETEIFGTIVFFV